MIQAANFAIPTSKASEANDLLMPPNNREFLNHRAAEAVHGWPAMLGVEERILPSYLSHLVAKDTGTVVELGCYLGGSTVAILDGLDQAGALSTAHKDAKFVHSYDLFRANSYMVDHTLNFYGIKEGDSFYALYKELLGDRERYVASYAGDIMDVSWTGGVIKLLYVDMLWSWAVNSQVVKSFYTSLTPGSWLVHQDYVYSAYPWLPISMEMLVADGFFSFQHFAQHSTVAFRCEKPLLDPNPYAGCQFLTDCDTKLALLHQSANRFVGYPRALLLLSKAHLCATEGDLEQARSIRDSVRDAYPHPFARHHVEMLGNLLG